MALIQCPECGKEISDKAESCPHCGFPISESISNQQYNTISSTQEINGVQFDILEVQRKAFIQSVANVAKKVRKLCQCEQSQAEDVVYGYFLSTHGDCYGNVEELHKQIAHIKSWNGKKLYCPYCLSRNIHINETVSESTSK